MRLSPWLLGFAVLATPALGQGLPVDLGDGSLATRAVQLFLTWFVMDPVLTEAWVKGIQPMSDGLLTPEQAIPAVLAPFRGFMAARLDPDTYAALQALRPAAVAGPVGDAPLSLLVPSFILSEIQRAFEIGFLVYLPFLIIDLVTSAVLMSMGMMMVSPAVVSLPFKLAFFVVADGWTLISGALVRSYM